jgi:FixJ family two-component response regulator
MKGGAVIFLTKPIDEVALIAGVERTLDLNRTYSKEAFEPSPPREQQVLPLLASGLLNKQATGELEITETPCKCTVELSCGKWKPILFRS